ncbi:MAG TPA: efflux RND transporter periplasmic adaptor subunit [Patescibacteria group bacterium]|nr:efflux RND transporter periplasmic adaptor subunit [Patescibacteria group bacterium]
MKRDLSALSIDPAARDKKGPDRRLVIALAAAAVVIVIAVSWWLAGRRTPVVEVATVRSGGGGAAAILNASGYVTPRRRATVSAKITGKIEEVFIEEGMAVEEGQVLARLDDLDAVASLRSAEAEYAVARAALTEIEVQLVNARRTLERQKELRERDLNTEEDLDYAETAVSGLEAQITLARRRIVSAERIVAIAKRGVENCTIRAPFAGIVVSKDAQPGEMVSPISAGGGYTRTGIATIVDMASIEIEVDVNESYIARVEPGQRVEATLDAYPDWRIPASVRTIIPTADRQKATVKVRIAFDELDPRILPDMGAKVAFLERDATGEPVEVKATVPRAAVRQEGGADVVFVVKDGSVERRTISIGARRGDEIEVTAGLRGGERVVVRGPDGLRDGQRVKVKE